MLSPGWLLRNIDTSWRQRTSLASFLRRLRWTYRGKRRSGRESIIAFEYPAPLGRMKLCLRENGGADVFILSEIFGHQYYRLPYPPVAATILDIGANIGLATIFLSRLYPQARVACVEPFVDNVRVLKTNLALNDVRATVFTAAVGIDDGAAVLKLDAHDYGHSIVGANDSPAIGTVDVAMVSVPTLLRDLAWERIGILKVDIEGYEKVLFAGDCDWMFRVDSVCIECHDGFGKGDLARLAERYGFGQPVSIAGTWFMRRVQ